MKPLKLVPWIAGACFVGFLAHASTVSAASCSKTSTVWSTVLSCFSSGGVLRARLEGFAVPKSLEALNLAAGAVVGLGLDSNGDPVAGCLAQDNTPGDSGVTDSTGCGPCVKMRLNANW